METHEKKQKMKKQNKKLKKKHKAWGASLVQVCCKLAPLRCKFDASLMPVLCYFDASLILVWCHCRASFISYYGSYCVLNHFPKAISN